MDNSQNIDVFSNTSSYNSPEMDVSRSTSDVDITDVEDNKTLLSSTKAALSKDITNDVNKSSFFAYFINLVESSSQCVCQSLDALTAILDDENVELTILCDYIEDIISILQLLGSFLKNVVDAVTMKCSTMSRFPVTVAQILVSVFTHCKESELLYGSHLSLLQNELRELFRTCHELQLIYLMILEKHFIFDLTQTEEEDVLLEALNINLKIGEIVESLDLKTMAEQWKAYTMICEKYSSNVIHNIVFENCTGSLANMTLKNIKSSLEENQDQKIILRSLKVSNFIIKILIKMCQALRNGAMRRHHNLVDLLINIYMHNPGYLQYLKKPAQLAHLFNTNVVGAADSLLGELLNDEGFALYLLQYDPTSLRKEDRYIGYVFLLITIMKLVSQKNNEIKQLWLNTCNDNLITCLFNLIPNCHTWYILDLKLPSPSQSDETNNLYEHLLTHTVLMATTFGQEHFEYLEMKMLESLLGTDCWSALFASDMWVLLARISDRQLNVKQIIFLCQLYQKLDSITHFAYSPQETHLSKTTESLFKLLPKQDKIVIYRQFDIHDPSNLNLWSVLKLRNLPLDLQKTAEDIVYKKLKLQFEKSFTSNLSQDDIKCLTTHIKLVATCTFMKMDTIEEDLIKAWLQICPKNDQLHMLLTDLSMDKLWFLEYLRGLLNLTESMIPILQRNTDGLLKVLHVASTLISLGNLETKLISANVIFKLALYNSPDISYKNQTDVIFHHVFRELFKETNVVFKNKLHDTCRCYHNNTRVQDIIHKAVSEHATLEETWTHFIKYGTLSDSEMALKEQLKIITDFQYTHRCLQRNNAIGQVNSESIKEPTRDIDNFEFIDKEMTFSFESDTEQPASKKAKLNINEVDAIITRLEQDIDLLAKVKENISISNYKNRLHNLSEKLKNTVK